MYVVYGFEKFNCINFNVCLKIHLCFGIKAMFHKIYTKISIISYRNLFMIPTVSFGQSLVNRWSAVNPKVK